jgi:hypothetical protein
MGEVTALHRAIGEPPRTAAAWRARMLRAGRIVPIVEGRGKGTFRSVVD